MHVYHLLVQYTLSKTSLTMTPQKSWQGADYSVEGVDDKLFTSQVVIYVKNHFCVDDNRIYATGGSNGGGMVASLACAKGHGSHFAAFAPVMAALYHDLPGNDKCDPATLPVPLMETHGAADTTIPYQGGDTKGGQTAGDSRMAESLGKARQLW